MKGRIQVNFDYILLSIDEIFNPGFPLQEKKIERRKENNQS
jgi:hypothetical protein